MSYSERILIIDDNQQERASLANALRQAGFAFIFVAYNGQEGVDFIKQGQMDVIIVETDLIDKNGFEVCRELRRVKDNLANIILQTKTQQDKGVLFEKAKACGADDFVPKTSDHKSILEAIQKMLNN